MSNHDTSIPLLKGNITIVAYENTDAGSAQRYLLRLCDDYFLISVKVRALILALLRCPETQQQLESDFAAQAGERIPAATLITLAKQTLPPALFRDTPQPLRRKPFIVSATLVAPRYAARMAAWLAWLFKPQCVLPIVALFVLVHTMVLPDALRSVHGSWTVPQTCTLVLLFLASGLLHECGHIAACRYYRCGHGGIGCGLYLVFPVWYADVTQAWQLQRRQRAVVDLGGLYFQAIFLIAVDVVALVNGNPVAFKLAWLVTFAMLLTLNPVFKFDGYWLLSDLSGLHNLHRQVRQSIATLIARTMGKQSASKPPLQAAILHAYLLLSACYFVYLGLFLGRELFSSGVLFASMTGAGWQESIFVDRMGWAEAALAIGHVVGTLVWPFMIMLASMFFLNRFRLGMRMIVSSIHEARTLPSRRHST
jgi:putative peptide zinc metalloprotease protein